MNELIVAGASIAALGLAAAVFAEPLARSQERVVQMLPRPLERFYRIIGAGAPFDSPPWIAYNRIGGTLIALLGTALAAYTATRG
jgi:Flp pilus assembly protein TadB